jgi:sortase A
MKNKTKRRTNLKDIFLQLLFFCMIFIALLFIFSPWLTQALIEQKRIQYSIFNFTTEEIRENLVLAESIEGQSDIDEQADIEAPDFGTVLANISDVKRQDVVGAIAISDLNLLLPVLNGTETSNLMAGATTIKAGQVMGKGNYCLAGHHMKNNELLFGPLLQIKVGSLIQLSDKHTVYTYKVTETKVVHETDLSLLEDESVPSVTLITCDISGINTNNRFVVIGELVDESIESVIESSGTTNNEYVTQYKYQINQIKKEVAAVKYSLNYWLIIILFLTLVIQILLMKLSRDHLISLKHNFKMTP